MRLCVRVFLLALLLCAAGAWPALSQMAPEPAATPLPEPIFPDALSVTASVEPDLLVAPETVRLTVTLTNTGATPIGDVRLMRPNGAVVAQLGTLDPGVSQAFEENLALSLEQFRTGGVVYMVRCVLNPDTPDAVGGRMTVRAPLERIAAQPAVEFSRSVSTEYVQAGEQVALTYRVVNTGNVPLIDLVVSDPLTGDVGLLDELPPGRKHTFTTRVEIDSDGESLPTLTCFSKADPETPIVRDLGATRIQVTDQKLEAHLFADSVAINRGEPVTLRLQLHNASDIACEGLRVSDQLGEELDSPPISLKPGERYELTHTFVPRETTTFLLTVSGRTEGGSAISARSNALTVAVKASEDTANIELTARVNPNTPVPSGMVRFTLHLNNTGETTLRGVALSEQSRGPIRTLWVAPPGETLIEQDYPVSSKPFVFLAEMADEKGGHLTVLSAPMTVESAAQPTDAAPAATKLPVLTGDSFRLADGPSTFAMMMAGVVAMLAALVTVIAIGGARRRRKLEKQRRIRIKRIRRSMREPKPGVSQETRAVPVVRQRAADPPGTEEKRG